MRCDAVGGLRGNGGTVRRTRYVCSVCTPALLCEEETTYINNVIHFRFGIGDLDRMQGAVGLKEVN